MFVVTGGAGFIGSNVLAGFEAAGITDLVACDTLGTGDKWRNISKRELRDVVAPENLFTYLDQHKNKIKMVYHLGGISSTTETDSDLIIANNFNMSNKIWNWCSENDVRLVYASSFSTYASTEKEFKDDGSPEALAKLYPLSPYGWSKHLFDRRVARANVTPGEKRPPQWVGLKFFNVYGPNEYHKGDQMSVPCKLYPQVDVGASVKLFKSISPDYRDGEQKRDFIFVRDCVDVMVWLYNNPNVSGLFNLGTGQGRTFNDLAAAMFRAVGRPPKFSYIDMPQTLAPRYQSFTQADMSKLRAAGYTKPFTLLEEGVDMYVKEYLSRPDRYQ